MDKTKFSRAISELWCGALMNALCPYYGIILIALAVHGLLLLSDGVYWDGWLVYQWLADKNWAALYAWGRECGRPGHAYLHWCMGHLPFFVVGYKVAVFVATTASALLVYRIGQRSGLLTRTESFFVAVLGLTYPAFQVRVELAILVYPVCYCLFLLGVWLALRSEQVSGKGHLIRRLCALACFCVAFSINSLLTFYFGILLFLFLCVKQSSGWTWRLMFTHLLPRRLDYLLLPFAYWGIVRACIPKHGSYAETNYNEINLASCSLVNAFSAFVTNGIYAQINESLLLLAGQPAVVLLVIVVALWVYRICRMSESRWAGPADAYLLLAFGLALLFTGIFPYVAVGKWPTAHGWESRHSLLLCLPMALIMVACLRLAFTTASGALGKCGWLVVSVLIVGFSAETVRSYLGWQARWVKDRSIMVKLADLPQAKACSVFWVDDRFPLGGEDFYRFYEWAYLFRQVWGDERRIGIDVSSGAAMLTTLTKDRKYLTTRWGLSQLDPKGPQANLIIRCAIGRSDEPYRLCALYQYYRFLKPRGMTEFLRSVTDIEVQPLTKPWSVPAVKGQ